MNKLLYRSNRGKTSAILWMVFGVFFLCTTFPLKAQLSGTYTINPVGGNYTTFAAAVTALTTSGVSGPVVFNVAPATYNETIAIPAITGASAVNTITFNGTNAATCIITYNTATQYSYVIQLNGADYIRIQNLTINVTGTTYGYGIHLTNAADYNQITGCTINMNPTTTSFDSDGILAAGTTGYASAGNNANNTLIQNNIINGGGNSIWMNGTSSTVGCSNNQILNNQLLLSSDNNVMLYYQTGAKVNGNICTTNLLDDYHWGIYLEYVWGGPEVIGNKIFTGSNGVYFNYCNQDSTTRGKIVNNFITTRGNGTNYAIEVDNSFMTDIWYNSAVMTTASGNAYGAYFLGSPNLHHDVRNNVVKQTGTGMFYPIYISSTLDPMQFPAFDYNAFYRASGTYTYYVNGLMYTTLASLQTAYPAYNQHTIHADPMYTSNADLHSTSTSLNAAATPIAGVTTDIDNESRNATTPDIGADEFTPPTKDVAFSALLAPVQHCGMTASEPIRVQIANTTATLFDASVDPITVTLYVTGPVGQTITGTINSGTIAANSTASFLLTQTMNLSTPGTYTVTGTIAVTGDQIAGNNALSAVTINAEFGISAFPYYENFETTNGSWTPVQVSGSYNTWAWGTPNYPNSGYQAMTSAHSGTKAWMTGLTTGYVANEDNALTSPCLDFSTLSAPIFTFWMFYCIEAGWDGVVVDASSDMGATWVKLTPISPAYNNTSTSGPIVPPKYSGTTTLGWNKYVFSLAAYAGLSGVKVRVHFGSDGSGQYGGVAVDDIGIGDFLEKDVTVTHVQYNNVVDTWARIENKPHVIEATIKNLGYEANPSSVTLVYKANTNPIDAADGIAQTFTPVWSGNEATVSFTVPHTPAATGYLPFFVRAFYTGDLYAGNDYAMTLPNVQDKKTFGYEAFELPVPPSWEKGWTVNNVNAGTTWTMTAGNGISSSNAATYTGENATANDWLITPAAVLGAGSSYSLKFQYRSRTGAPQILDVAWGTSPDPASMTVFASYSGFTNTDFTPALNQDGVSPYFNTPNVSQAYYIGFHVRSDANAGELDLDEIQLLENPTPPPKIAYGDGVTFISDPLLPIRFSAVYKKSGMLTRTYTVVNATGKYGNPEGDFLWDVTTGTNWIKLTKSVPDPLSWLTKNPYRPEWARQNQTFTVEIDPSNMVPGKMTGAIAIDGYLWNVDYPNGVRASNAVMNIPVELTIVGTGGTGQNPVANATFTSLTPAGSPYEFRDPSGNLFATVNVVSGTISSMTITSYPGQLPRYISRYRYVKHYWTINAPGTGWAANVQFHYFDSEVAAGSVADEYALRGMRIAPKTSFWEDPIVNTTSTPDPGQNFVLVTNINPNNCTGQIAVAHDWNLKPPTKESAGSIPAEVTLGQNYPNPFNPSTKIGFGIPERGHVTLIVTNSLGKEVARLVDDELEAGMHEAAFDASGLPSGVYMYTLKSGNAVQTQTMILSK